MTAIVMATAAITPTNATSVATTTMITSADTAATTTATTTIAISTATVASATQRNYYGDDEYRYGHDDCYCYEGCYHGTDYDGCYYYDDNNDYGLQNDSRCGYEHYGGDYDGEHKTDGDDCDFDDGADDD